MVWIKAGTTTLSSAGDNIDSGTITANKFNQTLSHEIASGNTTAQFTFNGSTGSEYASRWSNNGGSENVYGTQSSFDGYLSSSTAYDIFNLIFNSSIVGEEKLSMMFTVDTGGSGAGNAPQRAELVSKYVPSSLSTTITRIECDNTGSGSFDTDSNITILGSDATDILPPTNVQDNSLYIEKETANRYWFSEAGADTTTGNTNVNDVAHFEGTGLTNFVIGEQITSGNALIGKEITSLSFWLYKLNSGTSGTETFTFAIWNSSGALQKEYGSVTRGEIPQGSYPTTGAQKFTKTDSDGYLLQENDIIGVRTNSDPNNAWTVEITQRDSDVYSNGQRALFTQGSTPTTSAKDIGFEVVSRTPATWINEFGVSDGLMFGGVSTSSYADYSDSQSWNGVSWTAGGSLTGARQNGASAGTGSTSARYVNGYNSTPAPYPNSNRNESYNGTAWTSDTVHPNSVNNKLHGGCGTVDSMLVSGGHANGTGDVNNYYKWTGSWTSITASGVSGKVSISGTLNSALLTKTSSAKTWNGTSWSTSTATSTSRNTASKSGISSSSGIRLFDWANTNPFNNTSEIWNGTSWSASGNPPSGRPDAGEIDNTTESMMTLGGQVSYGGTTHSTTVYELRKGVFTTGTSFSNSRRACGGAGS
jgi:hypothetical protein